MGEVTIEDPEQIQLFQMGPELSWGEVGWQASLKTCSEIVKLVIIIVNIIIIQKKNNRKWLKPLLKKR